MASSKLAATWHWRNNPTAHASSPINRPLTIHVPPSTDIWNPSPSENTFTAPFLYTTLPASRFQSVSVTVSAPWKTLYDQGGLVINFPASDGNGIRFIKAGIEYFEGAPHLGVVGSDALSDWSLAPLPKSDQQQQQQQDEEEDERTVSATVLIERQGFDAWVYALDQVDGGRRIPLRQITWAFQEGEGKDNGNGKGMEIQVGVYGAKPTRESGAGHEQDGIPVSFTEFAMEVEEEL